MQEKLFERRIVFVTGRLDDAVAAHVAAELMTLDATGDEPIALHLDSPDGTLEAALVLIDTLDVLRAPVHAHCPGQAGGPAVGVVAVADHRSAAPHATFRLTQPTAQFSGPADQLASRSQQYQDLLSTPVLKYDDVLLWTNWPLLWQAVPPGRDSRLCRGQARTSSN